MEKLYGYTVLLVDPCTDDKPWAVVRIEVQYKENPGKASQYIHVIGYAASPNIARYWASALFEKRYTEEETAKGLEEGTTG